MAGRGRGGGGGGRGRGRGMTFDARDMGFGAGEQLPGPVLQPPPTFPPLDNPFSSLQVGPEMEYMIALKKDLSVFVKDYMSFTEVKDWDSQFDWRRLPAELNTRRRGVKRAAGSVPTNHKKPALDLTKLDDLAKLEEAVVEPDGDKEEPEEKEDEQREENDDDDIEEDVDEEMDDGTDYVNNYFDNGEDYFDDDDNGNDGPVY